MMTKQAQQAGSRIGQWFAKMPTEQRTALIGALVGAGALGANQAMSPDQQDPATGRKRKKGVVSKALLGALLGGAAGAGLGYAGKNINLGVPGAGAGGRKESWLSKVPRKAIPPVAGVAGGVAAVKWYKPNRKTQATLLAELSDAWRDPNTKLTPAKYQQTLDYIMNETRKGGELEFLASRRARINAKTKLMNTPFTLQSTPLPQPQRGMARVKSILRGRRGAVSPLGVLIGGPIAASKLTDLGTRAIWSTDLEKMGPTAAAASQEAALQKLEGKK